MQLYILRHFKTPWNHRGLVQGGTDISLADGDRENLEVAGKLKARLQGMEFDSVLVSPLKRAQQTAELIGISGFVTEPLISEMNFGRFEGEPRQAMVENLGEAWFNDPMSTALAKEFGAMEQRICDFLAKYKHCKQVLLVSHGAFLRGLQALIQEGSIQTMNQREIKNGKLYSFKYDEAGCHH